jgi:hypothetical protein
VDTHAGLPFNDVIRRWNEVWNASNSLPTEGSLIAFLYEKTMEARYAKVDKVENGMAFLEIAEGVYACVDAANLVWNFVPNEDLEAAKVIIKAALNAREIMKLTSVEGIKLAILAGSAQGTFGGAAVTSGLANLGGGSVAAGGFGMVGGIVVLSAAPSMLAANTIYSLAKHFENDDFTPKAVAVGGGAGAALGVGAGVAMVSEAGTVAGLSGAGITSGLSAIGGTMIRGVAVVAGASAAVAVGVTVGAWGLSHAYMQRNLKLQRNELLDLAIERGFTIIFEPPAEFR